MSHSAKMKKFKEAVIASSTKPEFIHHPWFVEYHLEIVEQIAFELLPHYPEADKEVVEALVWLHDYGKAINFANQYEATLTYGRQKLLEVGFDEELTEKLIGYVELMDRKMEVDLRQAPIEVQIVASADGCSHMVGPFMSLWWWENATKPFDELMADNRAKLNKDWNRKIVLKEAREAFQIRHQVMLENSGDLSGSFID